MGIQLYEHQLEALPKIHNGIILNGGVGSGKSRTAIAWYFLKNGGNLDPYMPMDDCDLQDLYIITIAKKRDSFEWEGDMAPFLISTKPENNACSNKVVVDSWNNIQKYANVKGACFIFDENKLSTMGAWSKAMIKIAKNNDWIVLSATPGDSYADYMTVFIANGFYRNKTDFNEQHVIFNPYVKYPAIDRYVDTAKLEYFRRKVLVEMDFHRETYPHHEYINCNYDLAKYKTIMKDRWNPYTNKPLKNAAEMCYNLRRVCNEAPGRALSVLEILKMHPKAIIFYNFDYELAILRNLPYSEGTKIAEWNGHNHQEIPEGDQWVYLVNYGSAEAWNAITTDTMIFYSQNYSYKTMVQAAGRIDRLNTPYKELWYYHIKSHAPIDDAISSSLKKKKKFNEGKFAGGNFA